MLYLPTVINASEVNNMHCQVCSYPKDLLLPQVKGAAGQPIDRGRQRMINCTRGGTGPADGTGLWRVLVDINCS